MAKATAYELPFFE